MKQGTGRGGGSQFPHCQEAMPYKELGGNLKTVFDNPDHSGIASTHLLTLRRVNRPVAEYSVDFWDESHDRSELVAQASSARASFTLPTNTPRVNKQPMQWGGVILTP